MPCMLDLFSGSGSMARAFEAKGWLAVTVDCDAKSGNHTVLADVRDWDYQQAYPQGYFDHIHASPPCIQYSLARTTAKTPRDFEGADALVAKALEIINYFRPNSYTIENPQTGYLKTRPVIQGYPWTDICYCKYEPDPTRGYRKGTRFWNDLQGSWKPQPMCCKATPCFFREAGGGKHQVTAQRMKSRSADGQLRASDRAFTLAELHKMPHSLCLEICQAAEAKRAEHTLHAQA